MDANRSEEPEMEISTWALLARHAIREGLEQNETIRELCQQLVIGSFYAKTFDQVLSKNQMFSKATDSQTPVFFRKTNSVKEENACVKDLPCPIKQKEKI